MTDPLVIILVAIFVPSLFLAYQIGVAVELHRWVKFLNKGNRS